MSLVIVGLDNTIVNVALPSIQRDLHAPVSGLQWVVDAYTLVLASLLLLSGSTADRFGRRRTFQAGLATFTVGSLLCSLAPSLGWLVAFRMLQAVGGSMLNPVAMSIIVNTFTDRAERARAIGVWGAAVGVSLALGPVVGGLAGHLLGEHPGGAGGDRAHRALRARVQGPAPAAAGRGRPGAGHPDAGLADLRDHRGATARLGVAADHRLLHVVRGRAGGAHLLRAAAPGAAAGPEVLPQRAVLRGYRDRGQRVRRAERVPVPQHAVPAGCPRLLGAARGAAHAAAGRGHGDLRAAVRADDQPPGAEDPADRRGDLHVGRGVDADRADRAAVHRLAARLLRDLRHRVRRGERADHQHRGVRHAAGPGGGRGGGRVHQPAGG